ncbi:MAG: WD40 repeat domain-containing protein, partial [Xenococcaceae cyanobacterium MO_234.B1]|nr:WD40 repeat domain-containing protein [Xenococcaceae cyanobacterium MO_234.B1]
SNLSKLKFSSDGKKIAYLKYLKVDSNCTIFLSVLTKNTYQILDHQLLDCKDKKITASSLRFDKNSSSLKIFFGQANGEIQIWSCKLSNNSGKPCKASKAVLPSNEQFSKVLAVASSPNNILLVSAHEDETLKFWKLNKKADNDSVKVDKVNTIKVNAIINRISFSQDEDGQWLATTSTVNEEFTEKSTIKLFKKDSDVRDSYELDESFKLKSELIGNKNYGFRYLSFIPLLDSQNPVIVATRENGEIELYNSGGNLISTLSGHIGVVYQVSSSSSPKRPTYLYSSGEDRTIRMWKLDGILPPTQVISSPQEKLLGQSASFHPSGKYLAAATGIKGASEKEKQWIKLWQVDEGIYRSTKKLDLDRKHADRINSISFSSDGKYIASGGNDGNVFIWLNNSGSEEQPPDYRCDALLNDQNFKCADTNIDNKKTHDDEVITVSFTRDINRPHIIATGSKDGRVKLWSKETNGKYQSYELQDQEGKAHNEKVNHLSFSSTGQFIATASSDKTVKVWDVKNKKLIEKFNNSEQQFSTVNFQGDNLIVAATNEGLIKLWQSQNNDWKESEEILINPPSGFEHGGPIYMINFSPDGKYFASSSSDGTVKLWRKDGTYLTTLKLGTDIENNVFVESVMFRPSRDSSEQELVAIDSRNRVTTWDLEQYGLKDLDKNSLIGLACNELSFYLTNIKNSDDDHKSQDKIPESKPVQRLCP